MSDAGFAERILGGDRRAIARAATLIENRTPGSEALLRELFPRSGRSALLGITGAPGAGKSTFTNAAVRCLRAEQRTVGVLAVDPSSPFTGGAMLGDRVRMLEHHADTGVFVRSMATRGAMGGVARSTLEVALLLDAAGFDDVLVETVGVGQDEVEIARLADVVVVVLTPGQGDDIQALKAGLMEIADVFVLNKADQAGIEKLEREVEAMLALAAPRKDGWKPPVVRTVAVEGVGIAEALAQARQYRECTRRVERRAELWRHRLREMLRERLLERLPESEVRAAAQEVAENAADPFAIVDGWLRRLPENEVKE
ncbi:MAG: methylmalonyl Co-A mutase-associated GTPase MeaB [Bryobacter sp.]|nr:methylmalonyl Co-A mutase-associated GTPase MeaB [Bryobacter sp.]